MHPPLIPVLQTRSKSVRYSTSYDLPKLIQLQIRQSSKWGRGTPCSLVLSGTVTILAPDITSHGLLSLNVSLTCDESFMGFTLGRLVEKAAHSCKSQCIAILTYHPLTNYSVKPDQSCCSQSGLDSLQTCEVRWLWASLLRHSRALKMVDM
jgi:hypothetical protein